MPRKPSPRFILAVVSFGVFVAADDLTVVSTMLRQIIFDLEIPLPDDLNRAAWIVNAYLIAYVAVMPFVARLSDIFGRRVVYIWSLVLFLLGSIWVPLAPDFNWFIAGRVLTAVGGGAMVPVAMAVIGDIYPKEKRATAMGSLGAVDTAGWVWGPLYGALLIRFLSWRWQFYLNIPLSLIGIGLAWWALADLPKSSKRERIDWIGAALLTFSLLTLNIALLREGNIDPFGSLNGPNGSSNLKSWPLYLLALALILIFIFWQRLPAAAKRANLKAPPLVDLSLFYRRNFRPAMLLNFLIGSILIIAMVNVPLLVNVLENDVDQAAITSGLLLSGMTGAMALAAYLGGRLTEIFGYRPVTLAGIAFCVMGFGLMGMSWQVGTAVAQMSGQLVLLGFGFGLVIAPVSTAVINTAPDNQRGIAASLVIVLRLIGMSVGLSGLTAWGLRRFNILRMGIQLPDLSITDPAYQRALVDGLTQITVKVLAETFLASALIALAAFAISFWLKGDEIP